MCVREGYVCVGGANNGATSKRRGMRNLGMFNVQRN